MPAADVEAALVAGVVGSDQPDLLEEVRLFDVYTGAQAGEGRKSLAYTLRFRAPDRTLTAEETTAAQWQRVMNINLFGPFLLCRYLGAQMLAKGQGSIVNVASVAGLAGVSHRSAYNASKHGLIGLTRTLAAEWGGRGVRVNAVCPGWIKTEMDVADQGSGAYSDADIVNRVPMARFASPQDVAESIAFLADGDRSGFISGVSLPVDGGWTADASWDSLRIRTRV